MPDLEGLRLLAETEFLSLVWDKLRVVLSEMILRVGDIARLSFRCISTC